MAWLSWVALHGTAHTFIELDKAVVHVLSLISFLWLQFSFCLPSGRWGWDLWKLLNGRDWLWAKLGLVLVSEWICLVVSHSLRPHGLQPTRLLHPWDFPGKSTGVGCHCLLWVKRYNEWLKNKFYLPVELLTCAYQSGTFQVLNKYAVNKWINLTLFQLSKELNICMEKSPTNDFSGFYRRVPGISQQQGKNSEFGPSSLTRSRFW